MMTILGLFLVHDGTTKNGKGVQMLKQQFYNLMLTLLKPVRFAIASGNVKTTIAKWNGS